MSTDEYNRGVADGTQLQQIHEQFQRIGDAGQREYGAADWGTKLKTLEAMGVDAQMVVEAAHISKERTHKLLAKIADDPARAVRLVDLDQPHRIAEFARIEQEISRPKAPPAPPPRPQHWSENPDEKAATEGFYEMLKRRGERR